MVNVSQTLMNGSRFEKDWVFYHDALSQLTSNDTREWINNTFINGKRISDIATTDPSSQKACHYFGRSKIVI